MQHRFDYGDGVRVVRNVRNDGTFPGKDTGELLVRRGSLGTVVEIGVFLQDQVIYSVRFIDADRIVGCREEELIGADAPWRPSRFEARERVVATRHFAVAGTIVAALGTVGEVIRVLREPDTEVCYEVSFPGHFLCIPESSLASLPGAVENPAGGTE
jgi:nitrogen fixation protein NifZ